MGEYVNAAAMFGENVVNDKVIQERLRQNVQKQLKKITAEGGDLYLQTVEMFDNELKEVEIKKRTTI